MTENTAVRRQPTQARARARVEKILTAATELIERTGSDQLRMSEIAARAGVPIGSLYQYFPDKASIVRTLAERIMLRVREGLRESLADVESVEDALGRLDNLLEGYYAMFLMEPVTRDIWSGTQSDKDIQDMDIEDSRENARIVAGALKPFVPKKEHARLDTVCFLLMQLTGAAVRLAIAVDRKEGDRLVAEYGRMLRLEYEAFLPDGI
ncbi:AcrR family transcriptional regulator [Parvibaculum indicum]|uniref:TetR family transcriptional regulator n=1 Tax=Parvibaculum indicum TaxID=562969 RepID=UPI0014216C0E|nr:TetR family transcriptional regulator [Parvibaculum indicum]NIJ41830.1 AcrR family transcriptional regulator [Parvibaculum indicum]